MKDPRVDAYIQKSAEFAQPILTHIREIVHRACPDVKETIKWGFPVFEYRGILCNMASFKEHCAFGFWKASLVLEGAGESVSQEGMGQFGRIRSLDDLPPENTLVAGIWKAMELNEQGIQPKREPSRKPDLEAPEDFTAALRAAPGALEAFDSMRPSHRREYVEWITDARQGATRQRRIAKAVDQIAGGKSLNWKYE